MNSHPNPYGTGPDPLDFSKHNEPPKSAKEKIGKGEKRKYDPMGQKKRDALFAAYVLFGGVVYVFNLIFFGVLVSLFQWFYLGVDSLKSTPTHPHFPMVTALLYIIVAVFTVFEMRYGYRKHFKEVMGYETKEWVIDEIDHMGKDTVIDPLSAEEKAEVLDTLKAMETATSPTSSQTFPTPPELPAGVSVSNPNSMGNCGSGAGTNSARDWR